VAALRGDRPPPPKLSVTPTATTSHGAVYIATILTCCTVYSMQMKTDRRLRKLLFSTTSTYPLPILLVHVRLEPCRAYIHEASTSNNQSEVINCYCCCYKLTAVNVRRTVFVNNASCTGFEPYIICLSPTRSFIAHTINHIVLLSCGPTSLLIRHISPPGTRVTAIGLKS
jgi:hypothetical protein